MKGSMVLVIAVVVGALAAVMVRSHLQDEQKKITNRWDPIEVCVAKSALTPGTVINVETHIDYLEIPKQMAQNNRDYVTKTQASSLENQVVAKYFAAGKIIDRQLLGLEDPVKVEDQTDIDPADAKHRLITIKVNEETGTAGHIFPRDFVDVVHTDNELITTMVLQKVQVRYTGRASSAGRRGHSQTVYTSVTLEVSPREAMVLSNAAATGTLRLLKRSQSSHTTIDPDELPPVKPGNYLQQLKDRN